MCACPVAFCGSWPFAGGLPLLVCGPGGWGGGGAGWRVEAPVRKPALGRPGGGERGERLASPAPGFRGEPSGGAAGVFLLPGVPGGEDALVADDEQRRGEQHQRGQAHQAAPAAADVVGGGVLGGGEAAFGAGAAGGGGGGGRGGGGGQAACGAGAAGVGAAVPGGGVVVLLRGFRGDLGRDGEGLLGAAGLGVFWRGEDLGPVPVQPHRRRPEGAADLAYGGRALDAVVAVFVVAGDPAEFVAGGLGGFCVGRGGLFRGGVGVDWPEFQQGAGRDRAVEVAVADDGAVVGGRDRPHALRHCPDRGRRG